MTSGALVVSDLVVRYGRAVEALSGVSLRVDGGIVAVLGNNGAGKTTMLRAISGTHKLHRATVTGGSVTLGSTTLTGARPRQVVRAGVIQVPEGRRIFGRLSVEENLHAGSIGGRDRAGRSAARGLVYDLFPVLADRRRRTAGLLSGGEQQMLAIGRALMAGPKFLLLDEPSLGLAPKVVEQIGDIILRINAEGTAVLLIEQNADMALRIADYAYVLELGRVTLEGAADALRNSTEVQRAYLGGGAPSLGSARTGQRALGRWIVA